MPIILPQQTDPSWSNGFALSASESVNPGLLHQMTGAWVPAFGPTGNAVHELIRQNDADARNSPVWGPDFLNFEPTSSALTAPDATPFNQSVGSLVMRYRRTASISNNDGLFNVETASNNSSHEASFFNRENFAKFFPNFDETQGRSWDFGVFSTVFPIDTWVSSIVTWDNTAQQILGYLDGAAFGSEDGSGTWTASAWTAGENIYIGSLFNDTLECDGDISHCYLYDRAITPSEVQQLYVDPSAPFRRKQIIAYSPLAVPPSAPLPSSYYYTSLLAGKA